AQRSAEWASRLIGGDGATILAPDGSVLAAYNVEPGAVELIAQAPFNGGPSLRLNLGGGRDAVVVPMPLEDGSGRMAVLRGSFSPIFGGEEVDRLWEYATAVTAALDRVQLVDKVRQREESLREINRDLEQRAADRT